MRKMRKAKKKLIIIFIVIVIIATVLIAVIRNINKKKNEQNQQNEQQTVISLPDTTYSNMEVKDVYMEYLKNEDKTMVSMSILNTTTKKVENEKLNAILVDADGNVLGQMPTWIQSLNVGEQYDISVILNGNLTATQSIKLEKK